MKFRKVDWGLLLTFLTLVGFIWAAYAKTTPWDQAVRDVAELKPMVTNDHIQLEVLIERLKSIDGHLASIDRKTP